MISPEVQILGVSSPYAWDVVDSILRTGGTPVCVDNRGDADTRLPGLVTLEDTATRGSFVIGLSSAPARIGLLDGYDSPFAVGAPANFTLYDPAATSVFGVEHLHGKSVNSPYLSRTLPGQIIATVHDGYATVLGGELVDADTVARNAGAARG